jgi:hypothetical protein
MRAVELDAYARDSRARREAEVDWMGELGSSPTALSSSVVNFPALSRGGSVFPVMPGFETRAK